MSIASSARFTAWRRTTIPTSSRLDELDKKIEETIACGGTQMLMQGGHHPKLTKQWYLDLLSHVKNKFPGFNIHGFSPSEFIHFRDVFNEPLETIIKDFVKAGLGSIPGGGGEILVDRVRKRIAPLKAMSDDWLEVMDVAHRLGLASSATMMFGHVETVEDRIEHLERLRVQQEISLKGGTAVPAVSNFSENGDRRDACPTRPIHGVHRVDVSGGAHETAGADRWGARVFADAGVEPDLSG